MYYKAELSYLLRVLKKMHLPVRPIEKEMPPEDRPDMGLRYMLGLPSPDEDAHRAGFSQARENTIYRLSDEFGCHYLFLLLPGAQGDGLLVGPYTTHPITREGVLELCERYGADAARATAVEACFAGIPVFHDQTLLITLFFALGEVLWGDGANFEIVDIGQELPSMPVLSPPPVEESSEGILLRMQAMEKRYAFENELMDMVAQGRYHRAELMLSSFSELTFEQRTVDPVRNMKNYGIICNTLLRKAAERGGVHPVYLDNTSSHFARKIESSDTVSHNRALLQEMVRTYCQLVRSHSAAAYSPPVQQTLAYIEANLSGDLSLRALAAAQNISAGYLSALFRKETGKTLTEYVNDQRMEAGSRLLRTTHLQVQTIAQHCGIGDVNYFSKLFKKSYGRTPKQFRQEAGRGQTPKASK